MNPNHLPELGRALRVLGEHGDGITRSTPVEKLHEIRTDLQKAFALLEATTGPKPHTRCREHPYGAVDEEAPDLCLLCHTRRRRGEQAQKRAVGWSRPTR
ncbi:hypothetical protein ACFV1C_00880 [Streptomyces sp. NPDC059605]|uniref:hypothetical protein n=1 Tax=unclassified Streptomyces TaxID=2593676 RepID=UPI0033B9162C